MYVFVSASLCVCVYIFMCDTINFSVSRWKYLYSKVYVHIDTSIFE